ncbi:MAG TPA: hypothetical protein VK761_04350 [Solirubrobacteraceae bacterium]|jgi:hypothetical protein|nr:hypothetical protein [Solirubrobacteraceae bacterium]
MARFRLLIYICVLAAAATVAAASDASAQTFYVNKRNGEASLKCGKFQGGGPAGENPCPTIAEAVKRAEAVTGPNTIELSAEESPYAESIKLENAKDAGLTIDGEEPGVVIAGNGSPAVSATSVAGAIALSNVELREVGGSTAALAVAGAHATLDETIVENESGKNGVEVRQLGSLTMNGGSVLMENGADGFAVDGIEGAIALNGVTILNGSESQAEAGGVNSEKSTLAMTNTNVAVESGLGTVLFGVATGSDTAVSLSDVSVKQGTAGSGVVFEKSPAIVAGLQVEMRDASSTTAGVLDESETPGISSALSQLEVSGTWKGPGLLGVGEQITLSDSHIAQGAASAQPALRFGGSEGSAGLVVHSSVLQAPAAAKPGVVDVTDSNATIDSSEIIGGATGVASENSLGGVRTLTVAGSTVGPIPGVSFETPGIVGVEVSAHGNSASTMQATIEGSIALESQVAATANSNNTAKVTCAYSAIPSQIQSPNAIAGHGEIACASGASGNTNETGEFATLFAEPLHNYSLSPTSSAIDSVPASAISLPFGLTPSSTDVAGNPRVTDGNGDCVAIQDKGALELQGHAAGCPTPAGSSSAPAQKLPLIGPGVKGPPPIPPRLTALTISPASFLAAPSGPTIEKQRKKGYGAKISWRDSEAATTTLTVLRTSSGRRQGKSCKKPSKRNEHGKRCKLLAKLGSFAHVDKPGANSVLFSGRIKAKTLAPGSYVLQALPRNTLRAGNILSKSFTIK